MERIVYIQMNPEQRLVCHRVEFLIEFFIVLVFQLHRFTSPKRISFINNINAPSDNLESYSALDLRVSEKNAINRFFDDGNNKFLFAKRYVELMTEENSVPEWISEIREVMTSA